MGTWPTDDGKCDTGIRATNGNDKAFNRRNELNKDNEPECDEKKCENGGLECAPYGSETWTRKADRIRRMKAFETWVWKGMEKINWIERKTNEEVLLVVREKRQLMEMIFKSKKRGNGHVVLANRLWKKVTEVRIAVKDPEKVKYFAC